MEETTGASLQDVIDAIESLESTILNMQDMLHGDLQTIIVYILVFLRILGIVIAFYISRYIWRTCIISYVRAFWKLYI